MFETSTVLAQARPVRSRAGFLTASIVAHTAVIVGALGVSIASVDFPQHAPNETAIFMPAAAPPPLGNPNGGAPPKPKPAAAPPVQKQQQTTPPLPTEPVAPSTVPNETPIVEGPPSSDSTATGEPGDGLVEGPIGVPWGDKNGVGPLDAPPAPAGPPPIEEKVYTPGGEVKAPVLVSRVEPLFPELMRKTGIRSATVVVRCIIDKNGRVRDPEILVPAMAPFNDSVVRALQQWRYQPGSYRGQAVETYLHVTVTFGLNR
jgi:periplasmic protein TonB